MSILLFLIPLSLVLLVVAAWAFVWAVRQGQFDDMDTPAIDILRDDPHERPRQALPPTPDPDVDADADSETETATGPGPHAD